MSELQFSITSLYAAILAILAVILAINVIRNRVRANASVGDAGDPELLRTIRVFGNFTEYVPLALIILLLCENSGLSSTALHIGGAALVFARLSHAYSLDIAKASTTGRFIGAATTFTALLAGAGWLLYVHFTG